MHGQIPLQWYSEWEVGSRFQLVADVLVVERLVEAVVSDNDRAERP